MLLGSTTALWLILQQPATAAPTGMSSLWVQVPLAGAVITLLWKAWKEFQAELTKGREEHRREREKWQEEHRQEREKSQDEFLRALYKIDQASTERTKEVVETIHRSEMGVVDALNDMGLEFRVFLAVLGHKEIRGADTDKIAAIARRAVEEIRKK